MKTIIRKTTDNLIVEFQVEDHIDVDEGVIDNNCSYGRLSLGMHLTVSPIKINSKLYQAFHLRIYK